MVKPLVNKAYSMIEMLLILLLMSIFGLFTIQLKNLKMLHLKQLLTMLQIEAITYQKKVFIEINGKFLKANQRYYPIFETCEAKQFHINAYGNISHAFTLYCNGKKMVIQLGSGISEIR